MTQATWERQDTGWYTHPKLGGICKENDDKWYWYPLSGLLSVLPPIGPFETLREAKDSANRAPLYDPAKA